MFGPTCFTTFISCTVLLSVHSSYGSEIIGGKEVKPHSMPFMALLVNSSPACGGILIHASWVLTAAHCENITMVWLGVHSIKANEINSRQIRKVKKRFPHPWFDENLWINDLMLLKLDKLVAQTETVKRLKLGNTVQDPKGGTACVVAGWGKKTNTARQMSDVLMSVNVTVIDRAKCNSPQHYDFRPTITDSMVCAGTSGKTNADTCQGDSGGPLLCGDALVGVTSFGRGCGLIKYPGVYTFLSAKQLHWIKTTMKS